MHCNLRSDFSAELLPAPFVSLEGLPTQELPAEHLGGGILASRNSGADEVPCSQRGFRQGMAHARGVHGIARENSHISGYSGSPALQAVTSLSLRVDLSVRPWKWCRVLGFASAQWEQVSVQTHRPVSLSLCLSSSNPFQASTKGILDLEYGACKIRASNVLVVRGFRPQRSRSGIQGYGAST